MVKKLLGYSRINGNYRKNLIVFLLLASIPGIIFSMLIFFISKSQMENELETVHQNILSNRIESIKDQFTDLELLVANWAYQANLQDYNDLDMVNDYQSVNDILDRLMLMEGYNPLIGRVELYLNRPEPMIYTRNGYWFLEEAQVGVYNQLLKNNKKMFWNDTLASYEGGYEDKYAPLVVVHNLDNITRNPFGSLIVFLENEKFDSILQSPYEDGSVFLLQGSDQYFFGKKNQTNPDPVQRTVMEEINERDDNSKPFVLDYNNIKYTVTYDYFSRLDQRWYYVSIAPMTNITAPVVFISKLFIYLFLIVFILAIFLSIVFSRKLYDPIENITSKIGRNNIHYKNEFELIETQLNQLSTKSEDLQNRLRKQLPHLRAGFLLQLVQGHLYAYREKDLLERMKQFGWNGNNKKYMILFIQMTGFTKLKHRFSEGDEGLVTFLAVNIAEELMHSFNLDGDVINFHNLSLGILFSFSEEENTDEIDELVFHFSEKLIKDINNICKLDTYVGISKMLDSLNQVHSYFEDTRAALNFRNLQERNQIIEVKRMDAILEYNQNFEYPFDIEKEIVNAIRLGKKEEAISLVSQFLLQLSQNNVSEAMMKQGALKLLGSVYHIVLQSGLIEDFVEKSGSLYESLYKLKDTDEISQWFQDKVVIPIIDELSQKQNQRLRIIVDKVTDILDHYYMNDEISLEYCADQVNIHHSILSKVFREFTGWNFIDYLTNIRVTKAKELLLETDTKIKDIAESIGYKHTYFNRIFKKYEGITPSQFREINRKI